MQPKAIGRLIRAIGLALLVAAVLQARGLAGKPASPAGKGWRPSSAPKPHPVPQPKPEAVQTAIRRGTEFLLARQNKDGSWGSVRVFRPGEIYAPVPGAHQAFRTAVTALCISALIEAGSRDEPVQRAIDRGEAWLLEHLPKLRRATADTIYNVWGHAYAVQALVRMHERRLDDVPRRERIKQQLQQQIGMLQRYVFLDGGWGYYDFEAQTQHPSDSSNSFVTATVLVALYEAKGIGVPIPQRLVDRGMASIRRQRKPDFSYCYLEAYKYRPMALINRPGGSLGRSQVCNVATRLWNDRAVTDEVLTTWLDWLFARNLWLDLGRRRPIPHESFFQVAAYFFYYGHYYAALCIEQLPPKQRPNYQDHLAQVLLRLQDKDGSWWDFPMYDYHQQYGTAFAIMSLLRCRRTAEGK
jgi:hypothetical protein